MTRSYRYPTSIRLSRSLKLALQEAAHERGHNLAAFITWILTKWLAENSGENRTDYDDHKPA